jgi:hypothetical protein
MNLSGQAPPVVVGVEPTEHGARLPVVVVPAEHQP